MSTRDLHEDFPELSPPRRGPARDPRPGAPAAQRATPESTSLDRSPLRFGRYIETVADVAAIYGAFASAIVLIAWIWLTNVCLLFGAELDAEIERERQLAEGVPLDDTLDLPAKTG